MSPAPAARSCRTRPLDRQGRPPGALDRRHLLAGLSGSLVSGFTVTGASGQASPEARAVEALASYDRLLARYVRTGPDGVARVAYASWKASAADLGALDRVVEALAAQPVSRLARPAQFCTWVNLYNAITLKVVLARFPVRSIRDIRPNPVVPGPWGAPQVTVEGRRYSLDDIEHRTLRRNWREPRVHYAVNCASIGCPNLMGRSWRPATLEADLTAAARAYVNNPRGVRIDAQGRIRVSSIYHWFKEDFGGTDAGVLAHLRTYASADLARRLQGDRIAGHDYDWSINAA